MRRFVRDNGLSLGFGIAFLFALAGQAVAGHTEFNNQLATDGFAQISFSDYLTSSDFAVDVTENWQSEYLQFFLYIVATVWLLQRGSPESKELNKAGTESDQEQQTGKHALAVHRAGPVSAALAKRCSRAHWALSWADCSCCRGWRSQSRAPPRTTNSNYASSRPPSIGEAISPPPTSGAAACRTGSPSSSQWPPWPFSLSTYASAAPGIQTRRSLPHFNRGRGITHRLWLTRLGSLPPV